MLHLIKYNLLVKLKNFATTFWPLIFPILLGTMFYFAFGNIDDADFETVQVGIVKEEGADTLFLMFLDQIENNGNHLIAAQELSESAALTKLENEEISGIYQVGSSSSLTVASNGIPQSILQSILSGYETGKSTIRNIVRTHPSGLWDGIQQMLNQQETLTEVSLGGQTINGSAQFFYALIAMTCLYGCFIGFGSAITLQANLTALAARRCVTPTHKLKLILSEQIASFLLGYFDVIVLLIYLRYILKLDFQGKIGPMLLISFFGSLIGVSIGIFVTEEVYKFIASFIFLKILCLSRGFERYRNT